jgi:hypothetical protein
MQQSHGKGGFASRTLVAPAALLVFLVACSWSVTIAPDESGPTLEALVEENDDQSTQISRQEDLLLYLATRVPALLITPRVSLEPTPAVYGHVLIEDGACCVGGAAGSTLEVRVAFSATSPFAEVTEMRVRVGGRPFDALELDEASWEAYVAGRIYPVTVAINWTGFYVTAQFRDALGNLSPVYQDDISVEGFPSTWIPATWTPLPPL